MGAWDNTSFGNDDACDWGEDLYSYEDLSFVEQTLNTVIDSEKLDMSESQLAIAAAEVIARLQGHFGIHNVFTITVDAWVAVHRLSIPTTLALKAHAALDKILTRSSELLDLVEWRESDGFELWKGAIKELKSRIQV